MSNSQQSPNQKTQDDRYSNQSRRDQDSDVLPNNKADRKKSEPPQKKASDKFKPAARTDEK